MPLFSSAIAALRRTAARLGGEEPAVLWVLGLASLALWGFIALADEVGEGETRAFDQAILLALRTPGDPSDPLGPPWFEEMMRDFTALGGVGVLTLVILAVTGFLLLSRRRRTALLVLLASGGGILLSAVLKHGFDRPRPELVPHGSIVYTSSFPSGHSMMSAIVYLTLGALLARAQPNRRLKAYLILVSVLVTLLVGFSRIYLGVHWPTDVLAGWSAGAAWALVLWWLARRLQQRRAIEREGEGD